MAGFVQIIEYRTSKADEIAALSDEFRKNREAAADGPAPQRVLVCADRDTPGRYFTIVQFESYEAAMENSARPDTSELAEKMTALCDGAPTFYNLDLVQAEEFSR
jgi:quinol monooxygenase YgiN